MKSRPLLTHCNYTNKFVAYKTCFSQELIKLIKTTYMYYAIVVKHGLIHFLFEFLIKLLIFNSESQKDYVTDVVPYRLPI